jgi:hypothetical protein
VAAHAKTTPEATPMSARKLACVLIAALAACTAPAPEDAPPVGAAPTNDPTLATIALQLTTVPTDVRCIQAMVSGYAMVLRSADVVAGSGGQAINFPALPLGEASVFFQAYSSACASVLPSSNPTWVAIEPVMLALVGGEIAKVSVDLRRPTSFDGSFDFVDSPKGVSLTPLLVELKASLGDVDFVSLELSNNSGAPFAPPKPTMVGDATDFEIQFDECSFIKTVPPNGSCRYDLVFRPKTAGQKKVLFKVGGLYSSIRGTALDSHGVRFEPDAIDFGLVPIGTQRTATFVLRNISLSPFSTVGLILREPFAVAETTCRDQLAPFESCTIVVRFTPSSTGHQLVGLFADGLTALVGGTGTGTGNLAVTPSSLSMGSVLIGTSQSASLRVNNTTSNAFPILLSIDGDPAFRLDSTNCPSSLPSGAGCDVTVMFSPTKSFGFAATLSAGPGSSPSFISASVRTPVLTFSPPSFDFGNVPVSQTVRKTFTVSTDTTFTVSKGVSFPFQITSSTCGTILMAGQSCSVEVAAAPTFPIKSNAELVMLQFVPGAALAVTGAPTLSVTPDVGDFGNVPLGQSREATFTVTNAGVAAIDLLDNMQGDAADFARVGGACGPTLAANSSCTIIVRFVPGAAGARGARLVIGDFGLAGAALAGVGAAGTVTLTPSPFDYGNVTVGQSSSKTFTLANSTAASVSTSATFSPAGDFTVDAAMGTCPASLAPGASCSLVVRFQPTSAGAKATTLGLGAGAATAALSGTGLAPSTPISNLVVNDTTPGNDGIANSQQWSVQTNFRAGVMAFGDRTVTVSATGNGSLDGKTWLRTTADSKSFTGSPVATFTLTGDTLYLLVDNRHNNTTTGKPPFLDATYSDTGTDVTIAEGTTPRLYSVWKRSVVSGSTVSLPAVNSSAAPFYIVVVN